MIKNKILLSSVTLLSALMVSACGNGEKKTAITMATPTTEVAKETTAAPTTTAQKTTPGSSSVAKEVSLADTQRVGNDNLGYVNIPKDWVVLKVPNDPNAFQYSSTDKYNILFLNTYHKDKVELNKGETWGAELIANRLFSNLKSDKEQTGIQGVRADFADEEAYLIKVTFSDRKLLFEWVFQKRDIVYLVAIEGTEEMVTSLRPVLEQSWGLDSKTPGK